MRAASALVTPGRAPASTSARLTHTRRVSLLMPSCSAIRVTAPALRVGSCRASTASRVARSRSSSGYFLGVAMTLILREIRASTEPGALHPKH